MENILFYLLYPFAIIYKGVTAFRNHLYNIGHFHSFNFQIKTISVGNLTVGGTGKTPHIEYLIELLKSDAHICTLSRGYGRKTRGIFFADNKSTANLIGDEPMQYFLKYNPQVNVVVGEERALAIPTIIHELPQTDLILLDDAFQHRPVVPGLNILLCDFNRPFYEDHLMPAGRLRESRAGAKRAEVVLVSKTPGFITDLEMESIRKKITPYTKENTSIFFTGIKYCDPYPIFDSRNLSKNVLTISGIANPRIFIEGVSKEFTVVGSLSFNDHHHYTIKDVEKIKAIYEIHKDKTPVIVTTEKDMVKLMHWKDQLAHLPIFYIPIRVYFLRDFEKASFDGMIRSYLSQSMN